MKWEQAWRRFFHNNPGETFSPFVEAIRTVVQTDNLIVIRDNGKGPVKCLKRYKDCPLTLNERRVYLHLGERAAIEMLSQNRSISLQAAEDLLEAVKGKSYETL